MIAVEGVEEADVAAGVLEYGGEVEQAEGFVEEVVGGEIADGGIDEEDSGRHVLYFSR